MEGFEDIFSESLHFFKDSFLQESMTYALMSGGKRLRPRILYLVGGALEVNPEDLKALMLALEWIHTYSLIHDDLPGMDNDDYRRGKETVHKKFGEATAILAGDGFLNSAASLLFKHSLTLEGDRLKGFLKASEALFEAAGVDGMIQGQMVDLHPALPQEDYMKKTSRLFEMAFALPAYLREDGEALREDLSRLGRTFGYLYQLKDDAQDQDGPPDLADTKEEKTKEFETLLKRVLQKNPRFKDLEDFLKEVLYGKNQVPGRSTSL